MYVKGKLCIYGLHATKKAYLRATEHLLPAAWDINLHSVHCRLGLTRPRRPALNNPIQADQYSIYPKR